MILTGTYTLPYPMQLLDELFGENSQLPEVCETDVFTTIDQQVRADRENNKWDAVLSLICILTISEKHYIRTCMTPDTFSRETMVSLAQTIVANDNSPLTILKWMKTAHRPLAEGVSNVCRYEEPRIGEWQRILPSGSAICKGTDSPFLLHGIGLYEYSEPDYKVRVTVVDYRLRNRSGGS